MQAGEPDASGLQICGRFSSGVRRGIGESLGCPFQGLGRALGAPRRRGWSKGARLWVQGGGAAECPAAGHPPSMVAASWSVPVAFPQLLAGLSLASLHPSCPSREPWGGKRDFWRAQAGGLPCFPLPWGWRVPSPEHGGGRAGKGETWKGGKRAEGPRGCCESPHPRGSHALPPARVTAPRPPCP